MPRMPNWLWNVRTVAVPDPDDDPYGDVCPPWPTPTWMRVRTSFASGWKMCS